MYLTMGTLALLLERGRDRLSWKTRRYICWCVATNLYNLFACDVVYLNLTTDNIMLKHDESDVFTTVLVGMNKATSLNGFNVP